MVLGDPVDFLVCSGSRGSRSCRLDVYPERGNSLHKLNAHCRESDLVHQKEDNLVHHSHSCFARLIIDADRLICLLASAILNWLVTHLFNSLGRPNRLREMKHLA